MKSCQARAQYIAPLQTKERRSGAEEDGFALEHFDGEEEGDGGVNASGEEDENDGVPVIGSGDELLAKKADIQDGDEGELGSELDAGEHGGDGGGDNDKNHRREKALGVFLRFEEDRACH